MDARKMSAEELRSLAEAKENLGKLIDAYQACTSQQQTLLCQIMSVDPSFDPDKPTGEELDAQLAVARTRIDEYKGKPTGLKRADLRKIIGSTPYPQTINGLVALGILSQSVGGKKKNGQPDKRYTTWTIKQRQIVAK